MGRTDGHHMEQKRHTEQKSQRTAEEHASYGRATTHIGETRRDTSRRQRTIKSDAQRATAHNKAARTDTSGLITRAIQTKRARAHTAQSRAHTAQNATHSAHASAAYTVHDGARHKTNQRRTGVDNDTHTRMRTSVHTRTHTHTHAHK